MGNLAFEIGIGLLFAMSIAANAFLPVPITPTLIWLGQFNQPVIVITVATVGSIAGWLLMHKYLYKIVHLKPALTAKIPQVYFQWFGRHIGWWLFLINALPVPIDFIRLIAAVENRPALPLTIPIGLGRLVRNTLLVYLGSWLSQHQVWFFIAIAGFLCLPLITQALPKLLRQLLSKLMPKSKQPLTVLVNDIENMQTVAQQLTQTIAQADVVSLTSDNPLALENKGSIK